jgi:glyoxylase-like metal-dependent hydrolase (beta-lactamase superfamily II)
MLIEAFTVGMLSTNCYVVSSQHTKDAIIIDPGLEFPPEAQQILDYIAQAQLKVKFIVNTHGHSDHINGDEVFQEKYNVSICIHEYDATSIEKFGKGKFPKNILLENGSIIEFGDAYLKILNTPGQ